MTDKQPMQADGGTGGGDPTAIRTDKRGAREGAGGGESDGGAYPNPHTGKDGDNSGFLGHGGQTEQAYSGPAEGEESNAATR